MIFCDHKENPIFERKIDANNRLRIHTMCIGIMAYTPHNLIQREMLRQVSHKCSTFKIILHIDDKWRVVVVITIF